MDNLHEKVSSLEINEQKVNSKDMHCPICQEKSMMACAACKSVAYCGVAHQKLDWENHKNMCQPFVIKKTEDKGIGWVATRDLDAGVLLLEEDPVMQAPDWNWELSFKSEGRKCLSCGIQTKSKRTCSTCSWPVCSDHCEKNPLHLDNECKELALQKVKYPPPKSWKVGMLVICLRAKALKALDPRKFEQLMDLQDFYPVSSENKDLLKVCELPRGMLQVLSGPNSLDLEEFRKLLRICRINGAVGRCHSRDEDDESEESYIQLYLKGCHPTQSCFPNCEAWIGPAPHYKFKIRTLLPISNKEVLTINRCGVQDIQLKRTDYRQKVLNISGLVCKCKRCLDPTEMGTFLSGVKCFSCSAHLKVDSDSDDSPVGFLVPANPLDIDTPDKDRILECHRCHVKYPTSQVMATLPSSLLHLLDKVSKLYRAKPVDHKSLDILLTKYEENQHLNNYFHKNNLMIQDSMWWLIEQQRDNLDKMKFQELERFASRLYHRLTLRDKLYLSGMNNKKLDDLTTMRKALALLDLKFSSKMTQEKSVEWQLLTHKCTKVLIQFEIDSKGITKEKRLELEESLKTLNMTEERLKSQINKLSKKKD